jgi:cysteine sulfinate desulfinase/cysteine desulfurase-like protein
MKLAVFFLEGASVRPRLRAMYLSEDRARGSLRFSFGQFNSDSDAERAIKIVPKVVEKLHRLSGVIPDVQPVLESLS